MVSAIKHKGKPLYKYARQGLEVERKSRKITIHDLTVDAFDGETATFRVHCSKGTYVRTLAHDLGAQLGCHAHLVSLRRTASGPFTENNLYSLETILQSRRSEIAYMLQLVSEPPAT